MEEWTDEELKSLNEALKRHSINTGIKIFNNKPLTNADHIRMMSDDELADFLDETDPVYWTRDIWMKWLKEEYKP